MDSDDDGFAKQGGDPLEIGEDFDSEDEGEPEEDGTLPQDKLRQPMGGKAPAEDSEQPTGGKEADVKGQKVDNQPFDLAVDVDDSEEIDSEEEEDQVNVDVNVQASTKPQGPIPQLDPQNKEGDDEDGSDEEKEVPGAYNPALYANLPVSKEIQEVFEYITRYKP